MPKRKPDPQSTPTQCPVCQGDVMADPHPQHAGWLFCPGCEQPVWMPLAQSYGHIWVRVSGQADVEPILGWKQAYLQRHSISCPASDGHSREQG